MVRYIVCRTLWYTYIWLQSDDIIRVGSTVFYRGGYEEGQLCTVESIDTGRQECTLLVKNKTIIGNPPDEMVWEKGHRLPMCQLSKCRKVKVVTS
jgi:hypothetical protein